MKKYHKVLNLLYLAAFAFFVVISYRFAKPKYKPENFTDLFSDFSWLGNWPKWLDFPLMQPLNSGFDWLIVNYGMFFDGVNIFLLGAYNHMKNFLVGLPWPLVVAMVIIIAFFVKILT